MTQKSAQEPTVVSGDALTINYIFNYRDRAVKSSGAVVDGGHNLFVYCQWLQGNTTGIDVKRFDPNGIQTGFWRLMPEQGDLKIDNVTAIQSGRRILFTPCGHQAITGERDNPTWLVYLEDVAVEYPSGQVPLGADAPAIEILANQPAPPPAPGPSFSVDDIMDAFKAEMNGELGDAWEHRSVNALRRALQYEVNEDNGLMTLLNPTKLDAFLYSSTGLFNRLKETVWLQLWKTNYEVGTVQFLANTFHRRITLPGPVTDAIRIENPGFLGYVDPQ